MGKIGIYEEKFIGNEEELMLEWANIQIGPDEYEENIYIFGGCTFENCIIKLTTPNAEFHQCVFRGNVVIQSAGVYDDDCVQLVDISPDVELVKLKINSKQILVWDSKVTSATGVLLDGENVGIHGFDIDGNSQIVFYDTLVVETSKLGNVDLVCVNRNMAETEVVISNSCAEFGVIDESDVRHSPGGINNGGIGLN